MNELQSLYDALYNGGYYTKSFEEFQNQWNDEQYQTKVYDVVYQDGLYTKDRNSFNQKYSGKIQPQQQSAQEDNGLFGQIDQVGESLKTSTMDQPKQGQFENIGREDDNAFLNSQGDYNILKSVPSELRGTAKQIKVENEAKKKAEQQVAYDRQASNVKLGSELDLSAQKSLVESTARQQEEASLLASQQYEQDVKKMPFISDGFLKNVYEQVKKEENLPDFVKDQLNSFDAMLISKGEFKDDNPFGFSVNRMIAETGVEEAVVPKMNYMFGPLGFKFEEAGAGDYMTVTAPNGESKEISLNNFTFEGNVEETKKLKDFIASNATKIPQIEKYAAQYAGSNAKLKSEKDIDTYSLSITKDYESLNKDASILSKDIASFEANLADLNSTPAALRSTPEYINKKKSIEASLLDINTRRQEIIGRNAKIEANKYNLDKAVGKYSDMKAKQGTWAGATYTWLGESIAGMGSSALDLFMDFSSVDMTGDASQQRQAAINKSVSNDIATGIPEQDAKNGGYVVDVAVRLNNYNKQSDNKDKLIPEPKEGQSYKDWYNSLNAEQQAAIRVKVEDDILKRSKELTITPFRETVKGAITDPNTSVEWRQLAEEGFWGGAYAGLVKSAPAMLMPGGWAARTAAFFAQSSDAVKEEMNNNPAFAEVPESEKLLVTIPIGIANAVLEEIGLSNLIKNKGLVNSLVLKGLQKAGVNATETTLSKIIKNDVDDMLARGLLTLQGAALAEAETGAGQQIAEYAVKDIYNLAKEKEMFDTPDTLKEYVYDVVRSGAQEAVGGFVMGTPSAAAAAYRKQGFKGMSDEQFKTFEAIANDDKMQSSFIATLKTKVASGDLTMEVAKEELNDYRNSVGLYRSIPTDLTTEAKKEAMNLVREKQVIEEKIKDKDEALVKKQKDRIAEINVQLNTLSTNAVQEQTTSEVPIQSEAGVGEEVAGGKPTAEPQVTTEEVKEEEVVTPDVTIAEPIVSEIDTELKTINETIGRTKQDFNQEEDDRTLSTLQDKVIEAKNNISKAEDTDAAVNELKKAEKEKSDFEESLAKRKDFNVVDNLIADEIESSKKDRYEYKDLFEQDPRLAAMQSAKDMIEFAKENPDTEVDIARYENDIKLIEEDIAKFPVKTTEAAPVAEVIPAPEAAPKKRGRKKTAPAVQAAPAVAPQVAPTVAPAVAPQIAPAPAPAVEVTPSPIVTLEEVGSQQLNQDIEETKKNIESVKNSIEKAKNDIKEKEEETKAKIVDIKSTSVKSRDAQVKQQQLIQELKDKSKAFAVEQSNKMDGYQSDLRNFEARLKVLETRKTAKPSPTARAAAPKKTTETTPAKTEKEIKALKELDDEIAKLEKYLAFNNRLEDAIDEIEIEKGNTREGIAEIKEKMAKVREAVTNKETRRNLLEELEAELEQFKEDQADIIQGYKDVIAEEKAEMKKDQKRLDKLKAKREQMTQTEAAPKKPAVIKRGYILLSEARERFPLAADFIDKIHGRKGDSANVTENVMLNLLSSAYRVFPKSKKAAVEFLETLKQIEELHKELSEEKERSESLDRVGKAEFKNQLAKSGDFTIKQLRILNALVDSLQTESMPKYILTEQERKFVGGNSKNFFANATNQIVSRESDTFIHEIGHFGFFKILTGEDRVKFFEYMIESTYGKKGIPLKDRLAFTVSKVVGIGPDDQMYQVQTNVSENFSEQFAEQFAQWYMKERMVPAEIDTMFEKVAKFYNLVIQKLKSGKYVDKNLTEYFNKLSVKIEQKRAANTKGKKATAIEPELAESIQELEENLGLDFEDEFGLDDELSPMSRNLDSPLVAMAKLYMMKESGFFPNNVSTSHVNRDFYQFGLESKRSVAGTYYLVDINTKKMVNPFKTKRGGNNTSNMARKITDINKKRTTAKTNVKTKIGVAQVLAPDLNRLFSVNPQIIPDAVFDEYTALLDAFTGRVKVLSLPEINDATANVQAVLKALDADISQVESLAIRMDNYANKVLDSNGNLDFDATITNMKNDGTVTEAEYKLLKKHKKRIIPKVSKPKITPAQEKVIKDQLIKDIKSLVIKASGLATRFERDAAKKFESLLTDEMLEELSISRLSNILKLIDNINNGYFPHYAQLTINRLNTIKEGMNLADSVRNGDPLKVSRFIATIKAKLSSSDALLEMIKRTPAFFIDQAFGDFKSKNIYNAVFQPVAVAYSSFKTSIGRVNDKIDRVQNKVAKSYYYNGNKILESSFRMMTYMIQLEYESNPGSTQVNPAADYINKTIEKRNGQYKAAEKEMLQGILDKYGVVIGQDKNGNDIIGIDNKALYASFNKAEKAALQSIREINDGMTETAQYTASVIRGQSIKPLNNYVHLSVMTDMKPEAAATATILSSAYSDSLRPSTKAKNLEERTKGAKAISFDVYASAQTGAKSTLLDFYMTDAVRTVRGTITEAARMLEDDAKMTADQEGMINAVDNMFEEVLKNVLSNSFSVDSLGDMVAGEFIKQGYRAVLASTKKATAEFLSNIGFIIPHPQEFIEGVKYSRYIMSSLGPDIMMNVDSAVTVRAYSGDSISGRLVDTTAMTQSSGIRSSTAKSGVRNMTNMAYNITLKKYKNSIEVIADALISSPDKITMRPVWFGAFAIEFKKQSGADVDFDKIAANDEAYMQANAEAIAAARNVADEQSVLMGATNNPFMAIAKGASRPDMKIGAKLYHNFNNYMTTFQVFEFTAARQGIYAAVGNGMMSKTRGASLLAACMLRMTSYTFLTAMMGSGLIGWAAGMGDDDDEEKTIGQQLSQSAISTISGLLLGRDLGNAAKTFINYAVEKGNEKYLGSLRKGEVDPVTGEFSRAYDSYKDAIAYTILPGENSSTDFSDMLISTTGAASSMIKTAKLAWEKWREDPKKEAGAIERQKREIKQRIPLEILGNIGLVPLYKEVKNIVVDDIYESLKEEKEAAKEKKIEKEKKKKSEGTKRGGSRTGGSRVGSGRSGSRIGSRN